MVLPLPCGSDDAQGYGEACRKIPGAMLRKNENL
jgi:hypothetical protein